MAVGGTLVKVNEGTGEFVLVVVGGTFVNVEVATTGVRVLVDVGGLMEVATITGDAVAVFVAVEVVFNVVGV